MRRKILITFICIGVLLGGVYFLDVSGPKELNRQACAFCNEEIVNHQKFYEDDVVVAMLTHKPILPGHVLIIPKRHVERYEELTDDEIVHIHHAIQKVHQIVSKVFGTSSYLLLQKNGVEVGQTVPHVHFHYIPRETGDRSMLKFLFYFYISNFKQPMSEAQLTKSLELLKYD